MAFSLPATAEMTAPVEVSSCARTQLSFVPVTLSKPSRVPLPDSRPMQEISRSAPPTSDQLVMAPVKISVIWATLKSSTPQFALTMMAIPSRATMVSVRPVSSAFRALEERPMSQLPFFALSIPVPEPVGS